MNQHFLKTIATICFAATSSHADFSDRKVSTGTPTDLGANPTVQTVTTPAAWVPRHIVGIATRGATDTTYTYFADGTVSAGTIDDLEFLSSQKPYKLPVDDEGVPIRKPSDIIAMAYSESDDRVVTWYSNGTVSKGTTFDLASDADPVFFKLPPGKVVADIVGIAMGGPGNNVWAWYSDRTVSKGNPAQLDSLAAPQEYALPENVKPGHIIDLAISSDGSVHTWYHDVERGTGHLNLRDHVDARAMDYIRRYEAPGLSVAVSKDGKLVLEKGYGYRNATLGKRMNKDSRARIGSVAKILTALAAMHLHEHDPGFSVDQYVYRNGSILSGSNYTSRRRQSTNRFQPVVAKAISQDDVVFTWYRDGTVVSGTATDPDLHSGPHQYAHNLPEDIDIINIQAVSITASGRVVAWYSDNTYSVGNSRNFEAWIPRDKKRKVSLPPAAHSVDNARYKMAQVVGIDITSDNVAYVWYDDGHMSAGSLADLDTKGPDLDADIALRPYSVMPGKSPLDIRGIGINKKANSHVVTWLNDSAISGLVIEGWSKDLDAYPEGSAAYGLPKSPLPAPADSWMGWYGDFKIDHLLSHTSGLTRSGDVDGTLGTFHPLTVTELEYRHVHEYHLGSRPLLFRPGSRYAYSNHGMGLVGHIVAERSGKSYHDYVLDHIIKPLGLDIAALKANGDRLGQPDNDHWRHHANLDAFVDEASQNLGLAAGGWRASAGDLVRLMLATDRKANHPDILSAATLDLMESRPYGISKAHAHGWGFGTGANSGRLSHNGSTGGAKTYIAKYSESYGGFDSEITVAVAANGNVDVSALGRVMNDIAFAADRALIPQNYDLHGIEFDNVRIDLGGGNFAPPVYDVELLNLNKVGFTIDPSKLTSSRSGPIVLLETDGYSGVSGTVHASTGFARGIEAGDPLPEGTIVATLSDGTSLMITYRFGRSRSDVALVPVGVFSDSDADKMDDNYELANGLTVGINDSEGDLDRDGHSNFAESQFRTAANDPESYMRLSMTRRNPGRGTVEITISPVFASHHYQLRHSPTLNRFTAIGAPLTATEADERSGALSFEIESKGAESFFNVEVQPPLGSR